MRRAGIPLTRGLVIVDTIHPVHEGRVFRWRSDNAAESEMLEYGRTTRGGERAESWQRSPFFRMLQDGSSSVRIPIRPGEDYASDIVSELREEGQTDYLALVNRFAETARFGEMDCVYSSWATDAPAGFGDDEIVALSRASASLALAIKSASLARIAETLVETYLGRDPGRRVLNGLIERGFADRIEAVLWFSDLRSFTRLTESASPDAIIPFLNDYADAIFSAIHEAGGDILKLIGDGTLAIFTADEPAEACACALEAERLMRERITALNARRAEAGEMVTRPYLGLHFGDVFYGNIGSHERLDFTVVGPAVNQASRIASLCRSAERDVLASDAFRQAAHPKQRDQLVSVGRYALRGVSRPQELFTMDPGI